MPLFDTGYGPENKNLLSLREQLNIGGGVVTYGFEVEWDNSAPHTQIVATKNANPRHWKDALIPNKQEFPFLDNGGNIEDGGNWEVQSKVYNIFSECLKDMQAIKNALRNPNSPSGNHCLKSFHLHMRFPKSLTNETDEQQQKFLSWISMLGDVIIHWRLEHRNLLYTLNNWGQHRNEVSNLNRRGTVRLQTIQDDPNNWDLELRGFMSSNAKIAHMVRIICTALRQKSYNGFPDFQNISTDPKKQESFQDFANRTYPQHAISSEILNMLERSTYRYDGEIKGRMNVHLFGYEFAPYFNEIEKFSIKYHNRELMINLSERIHSSSSSNNNNDIINIYWECLKRWSQQLQLQIMLFGALLINSGRYLGMEFEVSVPSHNPNASWNAWIDELSNRYISNSKIPALRAFRTTKSFHHWKLEFDRSIQPHDGKCGFEIVSPVMNWDGKLIDLQKFLKLLLMIIKSLQL